MTKEFLEDIRSLMVDSLEEKKKLEEESLTER